MFCRNCGENIPNDSQYCPSCGAPQYERGGNNYDEKLIKSRNSWLLLLISLVTCGISNFVVMFLTLKDTNILLDKKVSIDNDKWKRRAIKIVIIIVIVIVLAVIMSIIPVEPIHSIGTGIIVLLVSLPVMIISMFGGILSRVISVIYSVKMADRINELNKQQGSDENVTVEYIILSVLFGSWIAVFVQEDLNSLYSGKNHKAGMLIAVIIGIVISIALVMVWAIAVSTNNEDTNSIEENSITTEASTDMNVTNQIGNSSLNDTSGSFVQNTYDESTEESTQVIDETEASNTEEATTEVENTVEENISETAVENEGGADSFSAVLDEDGKLIIHGGSEGLEDSISNSQQSEEDFKAQCQTYDYADLIRYSDDYVGKPIKITVQVQNKLNNPEYYWGCNGPDAYGWYGDKYIIKYQQELKLVPEDVITAYGIYMGALEAQSVLDVRNDAPTIEVYYIDLLSEEEADSIVDSIYDAEMQEIMDDLNEKTAKQLEEQQKMMDDLMKQYGYQ